MRFLFITAALLLFSYAMAKEENDTLIDDKPLTEQEMDEVVFSVEQEMVKEIEEAVKTINDVFGNPACSDGVKRHVFESELNVQKRGWRRFWRKVKTTAKKVKDNVKAGFSKLNKKIKAAAKAFKEAKRSEFENELVVEKRNGWKRFWGGVRKAYRTYKTVKLIATVAKATLLLGKRSEPEGELKLPENIVAENEFRADIAKLESALDVLNDVLMIAKASVKSK